MTSQSKTNQTTLSYFNVAQASMYHKKEQAVVYDTIDRYKAEEYIYAIAMKTQPENIVAASRITQTQLCVYFNTASTVGTQDEKKRACHSERYNYSPPVYR